MVDSLLVDAAAATRRLLWLLAAVMAGACTSITPPAVTVTGTATYRERMALPPDAVFEATLEDVTRIDAPAVVIASIRIEQPGNVGIPFEIGYDGAMIQPSRRYAVRGRILVDGKPFFVTDQFYPVLTSGAGNQADLLLRKVTP